ncbi:MAG: hypothetical protein NW220_01245 [Leptolyngbyaceae cyanobacterium bins.349]|nr:hypothetical protein [Leptolyngbyaceae cyanobacterium bins.349]
MLRRFPRKNIPSGLGQVSREFGLLANNFLLNLPVQVFCFLNISLVDPGLSLQDNVPADVVLGQADFGHGEPNRGGAETADRLHWCYSVPYHKGKPGLAFSYRHANFRLSGW